MRKQKYLLPHLRGNDKRISRGSTSGNRINTKKIKPARVLPGWSFIKHSLNFFVNLDDDVNVFRKDSHVSSVLSTGVMF